MDLKGPGGSLIGFPLITFDQQSSSRIIENESLLDVIKFTDVTTSAGLDIVPAFGEGENTEFRNSTHVEAADYDGDGDVDLYVGSYDPGSSSYKHYLFNNDMGRFKDDSDEAGIRHSGKESSAAFADYDNDGFPDLYIVKEGSDVLYRNTGKGTFEDVTGKAIWLCSSIWIMMEILIYLKQGQIQTCCFGIIRTVHFRSRPKKWVYQGVILLVATQPLAILMTMETLIFLL
jgi:hypothetical protein